MPEKTTTDANHAARGHDDTATSDLIAQRNQAARAYYESGEPTMTDDAFDALTTELASRGVEEQVGNGAGAGKIRHTRPMLSLRKVHEVADLEALVAEHPDAEYTVEPKWDGLAVAVRYNVLGRILSAAKRGDGERGEDITPAIRAIFTRQGIPEVLDLGTGEVRGEIVMTRSAFKTLNDQRTGGGFEPLKNPRNAAAGMIARVASAVLKLAAAPKDTIEAGTAAITLSEAVEEAGKWLTFLAYDADTYGLSDKSAAAAVQLGDRLVGAAPGVAPFVRFLVPTAAHGAHQAGINAAVAWLELKADDLDVDTDGVVVKFSDPGLRAQLGESSTAPRWALAYKYPNRPKQTTLRSVEWAETRTGRVVPTAVFDPVDLAGATVSRATLNNIAFLEELDVWIGDTIEVTRANEVIPNVVRRVGDHAEDAVPALDPNGWPMSAGKVVEVEYPGQDGYNHAWIGESKANGGWEIRTSEAGAYGFEAQRGMPQIVLDAALDWALDGMKHAYRRAGRDLVHDDGRDPVKDISFAAAALDILGLGEDVVRRLLAANPEIDSFPTLLEACREDALVPFERGTQKLVDKLTAEVTAKTSGLQDPARWIKAVGVPSIGYRAGMKLCTMIAARFSPMNHAESPFETLHLLTREELLSIDGFGEAMADAVLSAAADWQRWDVGRHVDEYDWARYDVTPKREPDGTLNLRPSFEGDGEAVLMEMDITEGGRAWLAEQVAAALPLAGNRVLVTGTLPTLSRKQAEARIEELGGTVASSVSKNLDLLVAGEKAGSKLSKAEALGIEVMDAATFEGLGS